MGKLIVFLFDYNKRSGPKLLLPHKNKEDIKHQLSKESTKFLSRITLFALIPSRLKLIM